MEAFLPREKGNETRKEGNLNGAQTFRHRDRSSQRWFVTKNFRHEKRVLKNREKCANNNSTKRNNVMNWWEVNIRRGKPR